MSELAHACQGLPLQVSTYQLPVCKPSIATISLYKEPMMPSPLQHLAAATKTMDASMPDLSTIQETPDMYTINDEMSPSPPPPPPPCKRSRRGRSASPDVSPSPGSGATLTETSDANTSSHSSVTRVQRLNSKGELVILEQGTQKTHSESVLEKGGCAFVMSYCLCHISILGVGVCMHSLPLL